MMNTSKQFLMIFFIIILVGGCVNKDIEISKNINDHDSAEVKQIVEPLVEVGEEVGEKEDFEDNIQNISLPKTFLSDVDFASQAPNANWELPYQEACEEAALIQAYYYFTGKELNNALMEQEILLLVDWEQNKFGLYSDTNLDEVKQIAEEYFNFSVAISDEVTIENIKQNLAKGYLVLTPTAGRLLENPNFTGDGPLYHFLVIRGYDRNEFITNDVGTKNGEEYKYKYDVLINAIHDLDLKEDGSPYRPYDEIAEDEFKEWVMNNGAKKILIVKGLTE